MEQDFSAWGPAPNVYHFNPETGVLVGQGVADPSPLEPGVFLVPAYATLVPPPAIPGGQRARWVAPAWVLEPIPVVPVDPDPPVPQPVPAGAFTWLQFIDLFTEEEQLRLVGESMRVPAIKLWYDRALGAQYIDLTDPRTIGGTATLVALGLIAQGRADRILQGLTPEEG